MSKIDYARNKNSSYAIVDCSWGGYFIVQVLARDEQGNVKRMRRNVLSNQPTIEKAQSLIDSWQGIDQSRLTQQAKEAGIL